MQTRRDPDTGGEIRDPLSFNAADAKALRELALQKGTTEARQHLAEILEAVKRAASEEAASCLIRSVPHFVSATHGPVGDAKRAVPEHYVHL